MEVLAKARHLDPGHPDTLGLWLLFVADRQSPAAALQRLDELSPTERMPAASLRRMRAHLYRFSGRSEEATAIEASLATPTTDSEAFLAGVIALARGHRSKRPEDYAKAVESFELAQRRGSAKLG